MQKPARSKDFSMSSLRLQLALRIFFACHLLSAYTERPCFVRASAKSRVFDTVFSEVIIKTLLFAMFDRAFGVGNDDHRSEEF